MSRYFLLPKVIYEGLGYSRLPSRVNMVGHKPEEAPIELIAEPTDMEMTWIFHVNGASNS